MAAEPGGLASKLGGIYERRYAAEQLIRLISGRLTRVRWEPIPTETGDADVELEHANGTIEFVQLKRQNGADAQWSVADLDHRGVLAAAQLVLSRSSTTRFAFVSADAVPHLQDICDQLNRNTDPAPQFVALRVNSQRGRKAAFRELLRRWNLKAEATDDQATALSLLRRMRWVILDRSDEGHERLLTLVQQSLTGEPLAALGQLNSFLEDRLGTNIRQQDVFEFLAKCEIRPRELERDPHLPTALHALRNAFRDRLRPLLVANKWLHRPEVDRIVQMVTGDAARKIVLVHGKQGSGKSGVLLGLTDRLVERNITFLPLSLSVQPPEGSLHNYGVALGLHATPAAALKASAGSDRAILLLDQIDALRLTTNASAATWQVCMQMLSEAHANPNITLVVACRTFDLENDANIRRWKESAERSNPGGVATIEIGDLAPGDIAPVLAEHNVKHADLPARLQRLLIHVHTLDTWFRLAQGGSTRSDFATQTQLLAALIDLMREEAVRDTGVLDSEVHTVLSKAREHMELTGRQTAPLSLFDGHKEALKSCCTVGLLIRTGGAITFRHQSHFDHLVARAALANAGHSPVEILKWLKCDQSLQRRDQLRQLLFSVHDEDAGATASISEALLKDTDVRFHFKQLVCGVLRDKEPITANDVAMVSKLALEPEWSEHVRTRILWNSPSWFEALHARGAWPPIVFGRIGDDRVRWLHTIAILMHHSPTKVDGLLSPLLADAGGRDLLLRLLPYDPIEDSPLFASLRESELRSGRLAMYEVVLERLAARDAHRTVHLAEAALRGVMRRELSSATSKEAVRHRDLRDFAFESEVAKAVRENAQESFSRFSRLLLLAERVVRIARTTSRADGDSNERGHRIRSSFKSLEKVLASLTAEAVSGLSELPADLQRVVRSDRTDGSPLLSVAVAQGLARASKAASDPALQWLCDNPERLSVAPRNLRGTFDLAANIIRAHAPNCSGNVLATLTALLLTFYPKREIEEYKRSLELLEGCGWGVNISGRYFPCINPIGRAQHVLLGAIPVAFRSTAARERARLWEAKFGGARPDAGAHMRGGFVGSPIPADRIARLTDKHWMRLVAREWKGRQMRQAGPDRVIEVSHVHFANDLNQAAKTDPDRFLKLSLQFPAGTPAIYFARLWDCFAEHSMDLSPCSITDIESLLDKTRALCSHIALMSASRTIEHHPELQWGEAAWNLLEMASNHAEPEVGEYTIHSEHAGTMDADIESTSINCVRGCAAGALAALAWGNEERANRAHQLAMKLADDPHPAVRLAAAHTALAIYTVNKDRGAALMGTIAAHPDDRLLAGQAFNRLIGHARWSHSQALHLTFKRMALSELPKTAELGSRWVTAEHFQHNSCTSLYQECKNGSLAQRVGVATMLAQLVAQEAANGLEMESDLTAKFDDSHRDVRAAASRVFQVESFLQCPAGSRIASAFAGSQAFLEDSESLVWQLSRQSIDLIPHAATVLVVANRLAEELAAETRSIQSRLGMAGRELSTLLLRLYDAAIKQGDADLARSCLDRWDGLLANRVGDAETHLEAFIE